MSPIKCSKCQNEFDATDNRCPECGTIHENEPSKETNDENNQIKSDVSTEAVADNKTNAEHEMNSSNTTEPVCVSDTTEIQNSEVKPALKNNKKKLVIGALAVIIILFMTKIICIHEWQDATCTAPKTCSKCEKTEGEPLEHEWQDATCTEPSVCSVCNETTGEALGHTESKWMTTKAATLTETGIMKKDCTVCGECLDTNTTAKKDPAVSLDSFNFYDDEFIDWINDKSSATVYSTDLNLDGLGNANTSYRITLQDGTNGLLILNHGDNGKYGCISAIMVYFEDATEALVVAAWAGEEIDSDFSAYTAMSNVIYGKSYSAANMTITEFDLGDLPIFLLAPTTFVTDLLS